LFVFLLGVTYEVTVYTGNHHGLCEDCEVSLKIYGEYRDSSKKQLETLNLSLVYFDCRLA